MSIRLIGCPQRNCTAKVNSILREPILRQPAALAGFQELLPEQFSILVDQLHMSRLRVVFHAGNFRAFCGILDHKELFDVILILLFSCYLGHSSKDSIRV